MHISWARLASFCHLGFISDPLIVSKFHNETHDPKGQENKIYTIENLNCELKTTLEYIRTMFSGNAWLFSETTDSEHLTFELEIAKDESRKFTIFQTNQYGFDNVFHFHFKGKLVCIQLFSK